VAVAQTGVNLGATLPGGNSAAELKDATSPRRAPPPADVARIHATVTTIDRPPIYVWRHARAGAALAPPIPASISRAD